MKILFLEYIIMFLIFFTLYYLGSINKKKMTIIPVKDLRHLCKNEMERKLYDGLINKGVYVSPSVHFGTCSIPLALEQYRIAIFPYSKKSSLFIRKMMMKYQQMYLKTSGWKVLFFSTESIESDLDAVLNKISTQIMVAKKA